LQSNITVDGIPPQVRNPAKGDRDVDSFRTVGITIIADQHVRVIGGTALLIILRNVLSWLRA